MERPRGPVSRGGDLTRRTALGEQGQDNPLERPSWFRIATLAAGAASLALLLGAPPAQPQEYEFITGWGERGSGDGQFGQFNSPLGVATDADGNVYVADTVNHRIQKFTSGGAFITKWGSEGSGDGQFEAPWGLATDAAGNVYVADRRNHRIQKFTANGSFLTKWGSRGFLPGGDGQFNFPQDVATDPAGNVYVADTSNHRIQKFTANGDFITKWGSEGSGDGQFHNPEGIATDPDGNVYVSDGHNTLTRENFRIQKFTSNGAFLIKWGGPGSGDGQFSVNKGVATDADGNVYVAEPINNRRIQKFTPRGGFVTKWRCCGFGDTEPRLWNPWDVDTDPAGNVYVADPGARIHKFGPTIGFGRVTLNRMRGIARMIVRVPGPGRVLLRQTKQVRPATRQLEAAGRVALPVRPRGKAQRRLSNRRCKRSGKKRLAVRVRARVTYRPAVGEPQTQQRRVRLVKRC